MKQTVLQGRMGRFGLIALGLFGLWELGRGGALAKPKGRKTEAAAQAGANGNGASANTEAAESEGPPPPAAAVPAASADRSDAPPAADPDASPSTGPESAEVPVDTLQAELTALMDELVQARTRAALVGKTLFKTQVRVHVQNLAGEDAILAKIVLKLDGAPIFRGDAAALRGDESRQVFEGFIAPGPHVLTAEVEQNSRDDAAYGYSLRETYKFQAIRDKRNELSLVLKDDSDVASEFPDDQDGEYDIRTQLRVRTKELTDE